MKPLLAGLLLTGTAFAQAQDNVAKAVSGPGTYAFLGLGFAREAIHGGDRFWRTADTMASSLILAEGLKFLVHAPRPDGSGNDSFPSGHATLAFAMAAAQSRLHPREAPLWFGGASWISYSRIQLRKHNLGDVLAGAGLGFAIGQLEFSLPHGLLFQAQIGHGRAGFSFRGRF